MIANAQGSFPNAGNAIAQVLAALQVGGAGGTNNWARGWLEREFGGDQLVDVWEQIDDATRLEVTVQPRLAGRTAYSRRSA